ncbi:MAG: hypothetical protein ACFFBP_10820 [Promethearchaeota archaeon]
MILLTDLNWTILEIIYLIIIFAVGFGSTYLILPYIIKFMKKKGYIGYDIHKNARPAIAESGGLSILIGFSISSVFLMIFFPILFYEILIFLLTVVSAGIIGFIDDRLKLRSRYKILLTILTGGIIFIANYFNFINIQTPTIPFLGQLRITFLYPLAVPLIVAVFANTVNMLEGYNGEGSGTCLIATFFLLVCGIIFNSAQGVIFSIPVIAVLIPFFLFNKFPAKIFPGDIGTLSMGAMIACIMLFGSLEVAAFSALLIHIFNSFYMISSVRGFSESSDIHSTRADIILLEDDRIMASDKKNAALTLPRLILVKGPLTESDLTKNFFAISIICGFFSICMTLFMLFTNGTLDLSTIFLSLLIYFLIISIPSALILYYFPRIRGVIALMVILLSVGSIFLMFIDFAILPINIPDIDLGFIKIPWNIILSFLLVFPGFVVWYYVTIKYFWYQVKKMKRYGVQNNIEGNSN